MITFSGATTKGTVREKNEDAYMILATGDYPYIFAVADGIGGQKAGETASDTAVKLLEKELRDMDISLLGTSDFGSEFSRISDVINKELERISESDEDKNGMGTTLTVMAFFREHAIISHIGDSAVFKISGDVRKLTEDHTFVNELLKNNEITEEEARTHPKRNLITKALGAGLDYKMDSFGIDIDDNETYIICTDGLFSSGSGYEAVLRPGVLNDKTADEITAYLISYADESGGRDNTTIITIRT